jgi:hypothetical protein
MEIVTCGLQLYVSAYRRHIGFAVGISSAVAFAGG